MGQLRHPYLTSFSRCGLSSFLSCSLTRCSAMALKRDPTTSNWQRLQVSRRRSGRSASSEGITGSDTDWTVGKAKQRSKTGQSWKEGGFTKVESESIVTFAFSLPPRSSAPLKALVEVRGPLGEGFCQKKWALGAAEEDELVGTSGLGKVLLMLLLTKQIERH